MSQCLLKLFHLKIRECQVVLCRCFLWFQGASSLQVINGFFHLTDTAEADTTVKLGLVEVVLLTLLVQVVQSHVVGFDGLLDLVAAGIDESAIIMIHAIPPVILDR